MSLDLHIKLADNLRHFAGVLNRPVEAERAALLRDAADAIREGRPDPALAVHFKVWAMKTAEVGQPEIADMLDRASDYLTPSELL